MRIPDLAPLPALLLALSAMACEDPSSSLTGLGGPIPALVRDHHRAEMRDDGNYVISNVHQRLVPLGGPVEQMQEQLRVGSSLRPAFRSEQRCGP
jgi:hypothetical protein